MSKPAYSQNSTALPTDTVVKTVAEEINVNKHLARAVQIAGINYVLVDELSDVKEKLRLQDSVIAAQRQEIAQKNAHLAKDSVIIASLTKTASDNAQKVVDIVGAQITDDRWAKKGRRKLILGPSVTAGYNLLTGDRALIFGISATIPIVRFW